MAQMQWQSFTLPCELKRLWKRAARQERISASEFLRRALTDRVDRALPKPSQGTNNALGENHQ